MAINWPHEVGRNRFVALGMMMLVDASAQSRARGVTCKGKRGEHSYFRVL
jgi:hypothetical protein